VNKSTYLMPPDRLDAVGKVIHQGVPIMSTLPRLTLTCVITGLLLAGCAHQPAARTTTTSSSTASTPTATATGATGSGQVQHHVATTHGHVSVQNMNLPDRTGIPACDDYLASYMACHRAAGIFTPDQLPIRYQAMRTSLLADSQNPDIRPELAARCNGLAASLRDALHGKSCAVSPAPASSAP
jgi:hypothetical protein